MRRRNKEQRAQYKDEAQKGRRGWQKEGRGQDEGSVETNKLSGLTTTRRVAGGATSRAHSSNHRALLFKLLMNLRIHHRPLFNTIKEGWLKAMLLNLSPVRHKHLVLIIILSSVVTHAVPPELQVPSYKTRAAIATLCEQRPTAKIQRENNLFVKCSDLDLYFTLLWIGNIHAAKLLMVPSVDAGTEASVQENFKNGL